MAGTHDQPTATSSDYTFTEQAGRNARRRRYDPFVEIRLAAAAAAAGKLDTMGQLDRRRQRRAASSRAEGEGAMGAGGQAGGGGCQADSSGACDLWRRWMR